jgi:hypothetical protein
MRIILFSFLSVFLTSCSPYLNNLRLSVKNVQTNDYCTCNYEIIGKNNKFILKDSCELFNIGDELKIKNTEFNHGIIFKVNGYVPFERGFTEYYLKRDKSKIRFRQVDSVKYDIDYKFRLMKNS